MGKDFVFFLDEIFLFLHQIVQNFLCEHFDLYMHNIVVQLRALCELVCNYDHRTRLGGDFTR